MGQQLTPRSSQYPLCAGTGMVGVTSQHWTCAMPNAVTGSESEPHGSISSQILLQLTALLPPAVSILLLRELMQKTFF